MAQVQDVNFVQPSIFNPQQELDIKRKRAYADAMMKGGQQPDHTEVISGVAVQQSPWAAMARAIQQGIGGYESGQADKMDADVQSRRQKMMSDAIGQVGTNPNGAASMLAQDPNTAPEGMQIALEMMKDKKALELAQFKAAHGGESGTVAAPLQLANEYQKARNAHDQARMNDLTMFAKALEKGQTVDPMTGQVVNMGGFVPAVSEVTGAKQDAQNSSDLTYKPQIANQVAAQTEIGKGQGEATAALNSQTAQFPQLVAVADKLSKLGKTATYTGVGQASNFLQRQAGLSMGQGATDRAAYIATVDNEVLPLLRQTFGAAFTQKEGESLKVTLGDPDKSPEEKDAVLKAFIQQKAATLQSLARQTGAPPPQLPNQAPQGPVDYKSKYGLQ